jgi:hypothetical protein
MKTKTKIVFGFIGFALMFFLGASAVSAKEKIKITSPVGGEIWHTDKTYNVTWKADDSVKYVRIYICDNRIEGSGNINYITSNGEAIPAKNGFYTWTIDSRLIPTPEDDLKPNNYRIRIDGSKSEYGEEFTSASSGRFTINSAVESEKETTIPVSYENENAGKELKITAPAGGETWEYNGSYNIAWQAGEKIKSVNIYVYDSRIEGSGNVNYITPNGDAISARNEFYTWTIDPKLLPMPADGLEPNNYQIRIDGLDQNGNIINSVFSNHLEISAPIVHEKKIEEENIKKEEQSSKTELDNQYNAPVTGTNNPLQNWWYGLVVFVTFILLVMCFLWLWMRKRQNRGL